MSKKRMMSKQQRLYYEQQKKEKVREQLREYAIQQKEYEQQLNDAMSKLYDRLY
jgi:sugar diacid utilization regulator